MSRRSGRRAAAAPPPSLESVQSKLLRIVCRHEQLKVTFHQLNSEIRTGLLEAEDVFASLAVQLMNLVGLKTVEMAAERRSSTIVTSVDCSHLQEEQYMRRAMTAGNELMERQKLQLMQLISLLKKIEAQVNSSQKSIFKNLADHEAFIKKFFLKAFSYVSSVHQSGQSNDLSQMMLKILKATFDQVGAALGSVEAGIDDLMCELADKMCNPMVEYVNGLKVEMKTGTSSCLLEVIKEMHEAMQDRTLELEEARKQARLAEQSRIEALNRLTKSEETARKLSVSLNMLTEDTKGPEENLTQEKPSSMKEDQAKDDIFLWELLRKKKEIPIRQSSWTKRASRHRDMQQKAYFEKSDSLAQSQASGTFPIKNAPSTIFIHQFQDALRFFPFSDNSKSFMSQARNSLNIKPKAFLVHNRFLQIS